MVDLSEPLTTELRCMKCRKVMDKVMSCPTCGLEVCDACMPPAFKQALQHLRQAQFILETRSGDSGRAVRLVHRGINLLTCVEEGDNEANRISPFTRDAADKLAFTVLRLIELGVIDTRTAASDALEAYAQVRFDTWSGDEIELLRELRDKVLGE
jgi:hypothetical protein